MALRSLFTHGLAAVAILVVALALARITTRGRMVRGAGFAAAGLSIVQLLLELSFAAGRDGALIEAVNRVDGLKMLTLAVLALAASAAPLPRWLRALGPALAVALAVSAAGYGLLVPALADAAFVSLPLLLLWVTGTGLALGRR